MTPARRANGTVLLRMSFQDSEKHAMPPGSDRGSPGRVFSASAARPGAVRRNARDRDAGVTLWCWYSTIPLAKG